MMSRLCSALLLTTALISPALAQSVQQSGRVTIGHFASWCANGVICDGGGSITVIPAAFPLKLRPTNETAYTVQTTDNNTTLVATNDTTAVTWNIPVISPFSTIFSNSGKAPVTIKPTSATTFITGNNGTPQKSLVLGLGESAWLVDDGAGNYRSRVFPATSQSDQAINVVGVPSYSLLTQPNAFIIGGTLTANDVVGFNYNYTQGGAQSVQIRHTVTNGDTLQSIALDVQKQIANNATLQNLLGFDTVSHAVAIQVDSSSWEVAFNNTRPVMINNSPSLQAFKSGGATETVNVTTGANTAEFVSELLVGNSMKWAGFNPVAGDIVGGLIFTGDTSAAPMQVRDAAPFYGSISGSIVDPNPATLAGQITIQASQIQLSGGNGVIIGPATLFAGQGSLITTGVLKIFANLTIPAGGVTSGGYLFSTTLNFGTFFGSGAPTLSAARGSIYLRSDGNPYVNTDGATTWSQLVSAASSVTCSQLPALTGDVTSSAGSCATTIANAAVTYAKIQNVAASRLLGNPTGGATSASEISLGSNLSFSGTSLLVNAASSFSTSVTTPLVIGGSSASQLLEIRTTTGAGVGADKVEITGGNNGAVNVATFAGNGGVGIFKETSPQAAFVVSTNVTTGLPNVANTIAMFEAVDATQAHIQLDGFGSYIDILGRRANGTAASKSGVLANQPLTGFNVAGYTSAGAYGNVSGSFFFIAAQDFTSSAQGTYMSVYTTPNGSTTATEAMRQQGSGGLSIGSGNVGTDPGNGVILATSFQTTTTTVSGLPSCAAGTKGQRRFVTDANAATFHTTAAGGGANNMAVVCDGTNWYLD